MDITVNQIQVVINPSDETQVTLVVGSTDGAILSSEKGSANGVATLDANSKIPSDQLPAIAITESYVVADNTERDALSVQEGDFAIVTSTSKTFVYDGTVWIELTATSDVNSVNGQTGTVSLDTDDIAEGATNKYTSQAEIDKLAGIQAGAEVNPDLVSQAEAEAGVATTERMWSAERVKQAITALASSGGGYFYDATVGTGGDYSNVESAIAGGAVRLLMIDNVTDNNAINLPDNFYLKGLTRDIVWTVTVANNYINGTAGHEYTIENITINKTGNWWVFNNLAYRLNTHRVTFDLDQITNDRGLFGANGSSIAWFATECHFKGSIRGFVIYQAGTECSIEGCVFEGEGANSAISLIGDRMNANNISLIGTFAVSGDTDFEGNVTNLNTLTAVGMRLNDGQFSNWRLTGSNTYITYAVAGIKMNNIDGTSIYITGGQDDFQITNSRIKNISMGGNGSSAHNVHIFEQMTISGSYASTSGIHCEGTITVGGSDQVINNVICTGNMTVNAGAQRNLIDNARVGGNLTVNASGDNNNIRARVDGTTTDNGAGNTITAL